LKKWIIAVIILLFTVGCALNEGDTNLIQAEVIRVVDGDTLKVKVDGKEETVRLLLIDTPETVHVRP
jgi:micrococcal nuclease